MTARAHVGYAFRKLGYIFCAEASQNVKMSGIRYKSKSRWNRRDKPEKLRRAEKPITHFLPAMGLVRPEPEHRWPNNDTACIASTYKHKYGLPMHHAVTLSTLGDTLSESTPYLS